MKLLAMMMVFVSLMSASGCVTDGGSSFGDMLPGFGDETMQTGPLTVSEVSAGLKEALRVGTGHVVDQVSMPNGYFADPEIKIKLPGQLAKLQQSLGRMGLDGPLNDLEIKMNRAAEDAAPKAKKLFVSAITSMTIDDAMGILNGDKTAATQFLRTKTEAQLKEDFRPIFVATLGQVGALSQAESIVGRYVPADAVATVRQELVEHSLDGAMDGLFYYLAIEEEAIRQDPAKQTTQLLKRVFGG